MMNNVHMILTIVLFIFLTACTVEPSGNNIEEAPIAVPTNTVDAPAGVIITPLPNRESASDDTAGYPIDTPAPVPTVDGYPAPPTLAPPTAYPEPEGTVWVLFPVGEQCAEGTGRYEDLVTAVASLTAAGILVHDSETVELLVCASCGCPTSVHYRLEIDATHLATAESLEWVEDME